MLLNLKGRFLKKTMEAWRGGISDIVDHHLWKQLNCHRLPKSTLKNKRLVGREVKLGSIHLSYAQPNRVGKKNGLEKKLPKLKRFCLFVLVSKEPKAKASNARVV
jgi:hypothetical protein